MLYHQLGLQYGPMYRRLEQGWRVAQAPAAFARLRPSSSPSQMLHPADLDSALQLQMVLRSASGTSELRLPFAVEDAKLTNGSGRLWASNEQEANQPDTTSVCLLRSTGARLADLRGFSGRVLRLGW